MNHDTTDPRATGGLAAEIDGLTDRVRGPVLTPGDDGYDTERAGFQTARTHRPDVIVGAVDADDVQAAVTFAATHGLPVATQATGHGLSTAADGGVLVTTGRMTGVRVDAEARTAWLEAGVRWGQVIEAAAPYGLAPLSGSSANVGVVGYTLGGGLGLTARRYGYAADHVRRIDVVTADGRLRHAAPDTDPDLFWALRGGGGGGFGVVTGLEIDVMPVARLFGGGLFFDTDRIADVLRTWRHWTATVPEELTSSVALIPFPDIPEVPEPLRGRHVAHVRIAYLGEAAAGERLVEPLRAVGPRLVDTLDDMPYTASETIASDPPAPHAYQGSNVMVTDLDDSAVRGVLDLAGPGVPVPCVVEVNLLGGALARPPAVANAVGHRDARYVVRVLSPLEPYGSDIVRDAHRRALDTLGPWTVGRCLNFLYGPTTPEEVRAAYEPDDHRRLAELKAAYDPTGMFRSGRDVPLLDGRTQESISCP